MGLTFGGSDSADATRMVVVAPSASVPTLQASRTSIGTGRRHLKVSRVSDDARKDPAHLPGRPAAPIPGRPEDEDGHACPAQSTHRRGGQR